jgi:hypothetical protein
MSYISLGDCEIGDVVAYKDHKEFYRIEEKREGKILTLQELSSVDMTPINSSFPYLFSDARCFRVIISSKPLNIEDFV